RANLYRRRKPTVPSVMSSSVHSRFRHRSRSASVPGHRLGEAVFTEEAGGPQALKSENLKLF
ncbi:hypothetical protein ACEYYA_06035, partial [Paracoccus sp. p3-h83]|uniref:hypothetical protein n=1 Tax=Paracoccus sp. p3-h83 TaxID=3342805 RepID=UPI0035BB81AE